MGLQIAAVGEHRAETSIGTHTQFRAVVWLGVAIAQTVPVASLASHMGSAGQERLVRMRVNNIQNKQTPIKNSVCPGEGWSLQLP